MNSQLLRKIHIYLSLICFSFLFLFCFTAITLNHPTMFSTEATIEQQHISVISGKPDAFITALALNDIQLSDSQTAQLLDNSELTIATAGKRIDLYIDYENNLIELINTDFGLIAMLNELHQNRHTPAMWTLISDAIAAIIMLICISGTWLSLKHKAQRKRYLYLLAASAVALITMA
ncbi:PepSY-associated TM helix domain-containing protein [Shewanella gelidimarina]|uniref:PepSY-associated TM helix domain-containing protein n=1 Tax=Shewanella gelidimarina TaxID=56813 RepID=UPI00200E99EC|nr:PepSY-associated TM helix domain-containing protein [Shewanella gelidimarina]MCL1058069.1 PepSY-associated TM helix domain-containing protein [Shewanella gelidimarina]